MTTADFIPLIRERIVTGFSPEKIILFGSQARENPSLDSNIDLLVVFSSLNDKRETSIKIRRALADLPVCKDIFVTTPEEIETRGHLVGDVLKPALEEGKVLYDRG